MAAWNDVQPLFLFKLARSFGVLYCATTFYQMLQEVSHEETRAVLELCHQLYCSDFIVSELGMFRDNDYVSSE